MKPSFRCLVSTAVVLLVALAPLMTTSCNASKSTTNATQRKVLRVGYLAITDHLTVLAKAHTKYEKVDFQPVRFGSWPELAEALKSSKIDGAFVLSPIALGLRAKGVPLEAVLLGHRNGSALTVAKDGPIQTVADLAGKTIAIPNRFSTHNILLNKLLENAGLAQGSVKIVELPPPEMVNALATKRIDAFIVAEPFGAQAEVQGVGRVLTLSKDIWPDHICCVLTLLDSVIKASPEAVQELVTSLVVAAEFIESDPKAAALASKEFLGQNPEVIERVLTTPKGRVTYRDLTPRVGDFDATQKALAHFGIATTNVELTTYVDDRFVRAAYATKKIP